MAESDNRSEGGLKQHWLRVTRYFWTDVVLFGLSFVIATRLRLGREGLENLGVQWPAVLAGSLGFGCAVYLTGLYSSWANRTSVLKHSLLLAGCFFVAIMVILGAQYLTFEHRIGRGVLILGLLISAAAVWTHHLLFSARSYFAPERFACLVSSGADERECEIVRHLHATPLEFAGLIHADDYRPVLSSEILGPASEMSRILEQAGISRIVCGHAMLGNPEMYHLFCEARYSGIRVTPVVGLFEEVYQVAPLELITPEWLLTASSQPQVFYLKKFKRAFDVAFSSLILVLALPLLLLAMLAVKLTSPGPALYRQTRSGRFGRPFQVLKLRTMRINAEAGGAVWAAENDPRVTPIGNFLRKYRIDEIPQLLCILRGQMSLVGPRPERPEFLDELAQAIPLYKERLLLHPGLTGWAQVNHPYAASIEDARRKLEYDLYYMKHMSLLLDGFILLDTMRTVLAGGTKRRLFPQLQMSGANLLPSSSGVFDQSTLSP